jgi:hypothetical protein
MVISDINAKVVGYFFNGIIRELVMLIVLFGLKNGSKTDGFTEP